MIVGLTLMIVFVSAYVGRAGRERNDGEAAV